MHLLLVGVGIIGPTEKEEDRVNTLLKHVYNSNSTHFKCNNCIPKFRLVQSCTAAHWNKRERDMQIGTHLNLQCTPTKQIHAEFHRHDL